MILKRILRAASFQVVSASLLCTFYSFFRQRWAFAVFPDALVIFAPLSALANILFLFRGRAKRYVILFNFVLSVVFSAVVFVFTPEDSSLLIRLLPLPLSLFYSAYAVKIASNDVPYRTFLRMFDFSILMFLLISVYCQVNSYPVQMTYMAILATSVSLLSVLLMRHGSTGSRGWISTSAIIVLMVLLVYLLAGYASVAGGSIIALWSLVQNFFYLMHEFFDWLFSLLPSVGSTTGDTLIPLVTDDPYRKGELVREAIPDRILDIALVLVLTMAGVVLLVYFIRRMMGTANSSDRKKRRIFGVTAATGLKMAFSAVLRRIRVRIYIFSNRRNAVGLYFWLCMALAGSRWHKRADETPRNFLSRIMTLMPDIQMPDLSDSVDKFFYGRENVQPESVPGARRIRACVRKTLCIKRFEGLLCIRKNKTAR